MVTQRIQEFACEQGLYYPVSFASEGSSQIGGNVATNAGGIKVIRHGMTRDWVAGLKVVTGHGDVLDCNRGLVKNASGYDLRHLFVGSEGTLGLICEATLRLADPPLPSRVMLLALPDMDGLMRVFEYLQGELDLSAFEFFDEASLRHVRRAGGLQKPFDERYPLYVVTEFDCPDDEWEQRALAAFEHGLGQGWLGDGVVSQGLAAGGSAFVALEGCAFADGRVYFTSKLGGRAVAGYVLEYDPGREKIWMIYESPGHRQFSGPDNIVVSPRGSLVICEDRLDLNKAGQSIAGLTRTGEFFRFCQVNPDLDGSYAGHDLAATMRNSEWAGATFSQDGAWLFLNLYSPGVTLAITGPWRDGYL